jgi:AcrR family transcriptional regulator
LGAARREEIIAWAMREVGPACRAFWEPRRAVLRGGMAQCDDTAKWERMLARFLRVYRRMPPGLRRVALRAARLIAPLYFPREEQAHSLGYRQLLERPEELAERFMRRLDAAGGLRLIPYAEFRYLSADGHAAVRTHLSRLRVAESIESRGACNKLYLSNAIDYLSEDSFRQLLRSATRGNGNWRALVNTSYSSPGAHPCLKSAEEQGVLRIDRDLTGRLRAMDRVGVYPGLAVIHAP